MRTIDWPEIQTMSPKASAKRAKKPARVPLVELIAAGAALVGSEINTALPRGSSRKRQGIEAEEPQLVDEDLRSEREEIEDDGGERRSCTEGHLYYSFLFDTSCLLPSIVLFLTMTFPLF